MPQFVQLKTAAHESHSREDKEAVLLDCLGKFSSLLIAFSGGTDSAYLAWAAHRVLGHKALSVTALSASYSAFDRSRAEEFIRETGVQHEFIATEELANPLYVTNGPDRCYYCKDELFAKMNRMARGRKFAAVAYGINCDDTRDFRPGHRAAAEQQVIAPLLDAGLAKTEIRQLAHKAGLSVWDRPASACLSSRIPYGISVTPQALARVEAGEAILRQHGFRQFRVRYYDELARIEIDPSEMARATELDLAKLLAGGFAAIGFTRVELDPRGYRQGSLNEALAG